MSMIKQGRQVSIRVKDLSFSYGERQAVKGIDFEVGRGEVLGFLGPNGAGKSTTVKMLTGQLKPGGGQAELLGLDVAVHPKMVQGQIGVCFEKSNLYEQMSALDNLKLFARIYDVRNFDGEALMERVGLGGRGNDKVASYSKGMRQRMMIARALVSNPEILFLDEPTDGLDPVSAESIRNLILEEKQRGVTIFVTTHDMEEADKISDRVAFINAGKIVALDTPHNLKQAYGKRSLKVEVLQTDGTLGERRIQLNGASTGEALQRLFSDEKVITIHSEEATLEDIFIRITGRGLV